MDVNGVRTRGKTASSSTLTGSWHERPIRGMLLVVQHVLALSGGAVVTGAGSSGGFPDTSSVCLVLCAVVAARVCGSGCACWCQVQHRVYGAGLPESCWHVLSTSCVTGANTIAMSACCHIWGVGLAHVQQQHQQLSSWHTACSVMRATGLKLHDTGLAAGAKCSMWRLP